jgi:hypothetical protein
MILALCLTSIGSASAQNLTQPQQTVVTNLRSSSDAIKSQISYALSSTANFTSVATNGYIVDPNAYTSLTISNAQKDAYNAALGTFQSTSFYNAQQYLTDRANEQVSNLQGAIHDLAVAAVDLQSAATVNQIVSGITDSPTAQAAQTAIANSGLNTEITATQVSAFNNSIQMVNTYATQAGAFFASANNNVITSNIDLAASNYNKTLYTASAAYAYTNDQLTVNFDGTYSIGFSGFTTDKQIAAATFFTQPQIYGGQ